MQATQAEVEQQVKRLTETLAQETRLREGAEQQAGEIGQRRRELEAQLGQLGQQLQESQTQLQAESQLRQELQQAQQELGRFLQLSESQQSQAQLRQQLEEAQNQLQAQKENYLAEQAKLEARIQGIGGGPGDGGATARPLDESAG